MGVLVDNGRLFLVDGMSQIYRAFYAIRGLTNSQGLPTNAVYGFITMLRRLVEQEKPHYLGVVLDPPGPTFRHAQYEQYKANRKPTPPDLIRQIPLVQRFCEAMNIPVLQIAGYEADDVIGTLSAEAERKELECVVVSIDKDMCQLVSDRTRLLDTRQDYVYLDRKGVEGKMGVPPERIIDLLSLWGDASDNIPGAPGIGEKGALELIRRFGSLEECLSRHAEVEKKVYRESLRDNADVIRQSRELVTIQRDLPIALDLAGLSVGPPNVPLLADLYRELEFHSLLNAIPKQVEAAPVFEPRDLKDAAGIEAFLAIAHEKDRLAFYQNPNQAGGPFLFYVPPNLVFSMEADTPVEIVKMIFRCIEDISVLITYDWKSFCLRAAAWMSARNMAADDVMVMGYLVNSSLANSSLENLVFQYTGKKWAPEMGGTGEYVAAIDELYTLFQKTMEEKGLLRLYTDIEKPLIRVLADMEAVGIALDKALLEELSENAARELDQYRCKIFDLAGISFNLDSPKQVGEVLFDRMQLPVLKRTRRTKSHSTDQEVLEELAEKYEVPRLLLEYRQLAKLKSTYMDALPRLRNAETGRIHTSFNQAITSTGRLSSSNPNLQNIPIRTAQGRRIREAFCAEPGHLLLAADYSQIELRIMAHLSEDAAMIAAFQAGEDIHQRTAREVFGMTAQLYPDECRRRAKVINFGILYGLSAFGLAKDLQISRVEAQRFIDQYFARYPGVRRWIETTIGRASETGEVSTLFGRIRTIPELKSQDKNLRSFGERAAMNAPIQGTAADLIKLAMVRLHRKLQEGGWRSRILLQVHDELVLEVPEEEVDPVTALVKDVMQTVHTLRVPLLVDTGVGKNWIETKRH